MEQQTKWVTGGCLCGAIKYEVDPSGVFDAGFCHCSMCRRASGAPVIAWAALHEYAFRLIDGIPSYYQSSEACRRGFCPSCGSQLFYEGSGMAGMKGIHTATLDHPAPAPLQPRLHMCVEDKLAWFQTKDELPRFADNHLTHPDQR